MGVIYNRCSFSSQLYSSAFTATLVSLVVVEILRIDFHLLKLLLRHFLEISSWQSVLLNGAPSWKIWTNFRQWHPPLSTHTELCYARAWYNCVCVWSPLYTHRGELPASVCVCVCVCVYFHLSSKTFPSAAACSYSPSDTVTCVCVCGCVCVCVCARTRHPLLLHNAAPEGRFVYCVCEGRCVCVCVCWLCVWKLDTNNLPSLPFHSFLEKYGINQLKKITNGQ